VDYSIGENPICVDAVASVDDPGNPVGACSRDWDRRSRLQKKFTSSLANACVVTRMKKDGYTPPRRRVVDHATVAIEQMKHYCAAHPGSPSAVRLPQLFFRGDLWIALLGPNVEEGIVGIGPTVAAALHAFDAQYLTALRPPNKKATHSTKPRRSFRSASAAAD